MSLEPAPRTIAAFALGVAILAVSPAAWSDPLARRAAAQASFDRAESAARALHFDEALAAYHEAIAEDQSAPFASVARVRAADLASHAEGGFAPLARLEAVRRDARMGGDPGVIEALERDAGGFPEGRVRAETRLLCAEAWWHRLGDSARAVVAFQAAIADPAADRSTRALALSEFVAALRERGDIDAARRAVERDPDLAPALRVEVLRVARRESLRWSAIAVLVALSAIGVGSVVRLARKLGDVRDIPSAIVRPLSVAFSLYLGAAAAVLVRAHGEGDARPFLWLGLGVLAVGAIARAWRLGWGDGRAPMRACRAVVCVVGVAAVAFLAVERTNAGYLESLGL